MMDSLGLHKGTPATTRDQGKNWNSQVNMHYLVEIYVTHYCLINLQSSAHPNAHTGNPGGLWKLPLPCIDQR